MRKGQQTGANRGYRFVSFTIIQTSVQVTSMLFFVHIRHIDKKKYLIFVKLESTGQIKCIFDQFCPKLKGPTFKRHRSFKFPAKASF